MIYIINLLFSVIWIKFFQNKNKYLLLFPVIGWILIVGFQYDVGVDYFNYYSIFSDESRDLFFYDQKEYFFYGFLKILRYLGLKGQIGFVLISIISNLIFYKALLEYKKRFNLDLSMIIFLSFTIIPIFTAQMNGIRQYVAIYIFFLSGAYLNVDKKKFFKLNLIAGLIHSSIFLSLLFYFIKNILNKRHRRKSIIIFLIISLLVSLIDINLKSIFSNLESLGKYSYYLNSKLAEKNIDILFKVTKWIYLPLYFLAIYYFKKMKLSFRDNFLYNLGMFSYSLKMVCLITFLTVRISSIFNLFTIFPIYYLLKYLKRNDKQNEYYIIVIYILILFVLKHYLIPTDEIIYKNYIYKLIVEPQSYLNIR